MRIQKSTNLEETIPFSEAYKELSDLLTTPDTILDIGSFENFVLEQGPRSFPMYSWNSWHIRKMCAAVDEMLSSNNKYLLAVLPRYHLKSTILNNFLSIYRMLTMATSYGEGLIISYKEELATIHSVHTKEIIRNNEYLSSIMQDLSLQSDSSISYKIGNKRCRVYSSGIFGVKRGLHTNLLTCVDDVQGDLQNPMTFTEIEKSTRMFDAEILNIPNKDCPLVIFGTVISNNDLLFHLKEKEAFQEHMLWMPALYPDSEHEVLWEEMYNKIWLDQRKIDGGWKAFSTEFLLTPIYSTEAFFTHEQLSKTIDKSLTNYQPPGW